MGSGHTYKYPWVTVVVSVPYCRLMRPAGPVHFRRIASSCMIKKALLKAAGAQRKEYNMGDAIITTHFEVVDNVGGENYIYRIPDCQMFRLHKGDELHLRRYSGPGYLFNFREWWTVEVVDEPPLEINWSRSDPDHTAYDVGSVITRQIVHVKVKSHEHV